MSDVDLASGSIAIIGLAGHFPDARNPGELWQILADGREATRWLSDEELLAGGESAAALSDPNYVKAAMVLPDMDRFDAGFFGFSPREAAILDPQHRHFLEACWEALEDAGHTPGRFPGAVGVFGGCGMQAYMAYNLLSNRELVEKVGLFLLRHTGNDKDFLTTRASYLLNLKGPSVGIQTACSTSLVAVHVACQSLLAGECDMALAGGVTIEVPHGRGYRFAEGEILAADGHCRAFDDNSSGTLFGSGVGVVALRRVEDALADGDQIYAVIRGSAVNNDGSRKIGYLAPSVEGQTQAASEALAIAQVDPSTIEYIEAHGTGTVVGDPIELAALADAYGGAARGSIGVGSIKTNIGHLDTAAGVASLIKVALALRHGTLPASLNFKTPNSRFAFAESPFHVLSKARSWAPSARKRRAAVNALGVGGTNAHVIVEESPERPPVPRIAMPHLVLLSGKTKDSLLGLADKWRTYLAAPPREFEAFDAAFTTQEGRDHFTHRKAIVGSNAAELLSALDSRGARLGSATGVARAKPKVVFMFPGGGAQYPGAAKRLYATEAVFRRAVDDCFAQMPSRAPADLKAHMFAGAGSGTSAALEHPTRSILAIFIIEYALARLWQHWGVRPDAVIGHSSGEYAGATVAGVMTLKDALSTVTLRGEIFEAAPRGGMLSVKAGEAKVRALIGDDLDLAAVNAAELTVVSGGTEALAAFAGRLKELGIDSAPVRIDVAAHSRMLDAALPGFYAHLRTIELKDPSIPFISNLSGAWAAAGDVSNSGYWVRHLRETVRFGEGLSAALDRPDTILLEVGPGQAMSALGRLAGGREEPLAVVASLPAAADDADDAVFARTSAGALWAHGVELDFEALRGSKVKRRISLPTYAFDKQRHWIEPGRAVVADMPASDEIAITRTADIDKWFSAPQWLPKPLVRADSIARQRWLVFSGRSALSRAVVERLTSESALAAEVVAGERFERIDQRRFSVRPECPTDYDQLIDALSGIDVEPNNILHLWSLDAPGPDLTRGTFSQPLGFDSIFCLARSIQMAGIESGIHLAIGTSGTVPLEDPGRARPDRAALVGAARVLPKEMPGLAAKLINVASTLDPDVAAARLMEEAASSSHDSLVTLGADGRYVLGEVSTGEPVPNASSRLRERGVYLITGGLGGIGFELAEYLGRTLKARLALTTRGAFPDRADWPAIAVSGDRGPVADRVRRLLALEAAGAECSVIRADPTSFGETSRALSDIRARFGSINGIIHAAGTIDDGLVATKPLDRAHAVLSAKALGALILNELLPAGTLDVFAVFSSTSASVGLPGQIDYAGANAVLDSIAASRPDGLAIAWGVWSDIGMAARATGRDRRSRPAHPDEHPLLGAETVDEQGISFTSVLKPSDHWVMSEHKVRGRSVLPGMAYLEMLVAAARRAGLGRIQIDNASFIAPLPADSDGERELRTRLDRGSGGCYEATIESRTGDQADRLRHFSARLSEAGARPEPALELSSRRDPVPADLHTMATRGLELGRRWMCLDSVERSATEVVASISLKSEFADDLQQFSAHPATLDVAATVGLFALPGHDEGGKLFVPLSIGSFRLYAPLPRTYRASAKLKAPPGAGHALFDVELTAPDGQLLVDIRDLAMWNVQGSDFLVGHEEKPRETRPPILDQLVAAGIRREEAPRLFTAAFASPGRKVIVTPTPLSTLRAAFQPKPALRRKSPAKAAATDGFSGGDDIEAKISRMCADILGLDAVDPDTDILSYGGGSLMGVRLFVRIKKELGAEFTLSALFQAPTVRELAAHVRSLTAPKPQERVLQAAAGAVGGTELRPATQPWSPLVRIKAGSGSRRPLYCIHGSGGNVVMFKAIADRLTGGRGMYGLQARGTDGKLPPHEGVAEMASCYLEAIRQVDPLGPYYLAGYSGGGVIAYEMAQQLMSSGAEVGRLIMFDTLEPTENFIHGRLDKLKQITKIGARSLLSWPRGRLEHIIRGRFAGNVRAGRIPKHATSFQIAEVLMTDAYFRAQDEYKPKPYAGDLLLFRASRRSFIYACSGNELGWSKFVSGHIRTVSVDADHATVLSPPAIDALMVTLNRELEALDVEPSRFETQEAA